MIFSTVAEYDTEIAVVSEAITRALKLGASHSSSVAGNSRGNAEVNINDLLKYRLELIKERDILKGRVLYLKAGW